MSHTVCRPVISMRSSRGPSVTFTLRRTARGAQARARAGGVEVGQGAAQGLVHMRRHARASTQRLPRSCEGAARRREPPQPKAHTSLNR